MRRRKLRKLRFKKYAYGCMMYTLTIVVVLIGSYSLFNWMHYSEEEHRTRTTNIVVVQAMNELGCPPRRVIVAMEYGKTNKIHYEVKSCIWLGITRKAATAMWRSIEVGNTYRIESAEINGFRTIERVETLK